MSIISKVKRAIAKTAQAVADDQVFETIPFCEVLETTDKISIKAVFTDCTYGDSEGTITNDGVLQFIVSDKGTLNRILFVGKLVDGLGLEINTQNGQKVMGIRLPETSQTNMGKILHPMGNTIYKIKFDSNLSFGNEWVISKSDTDYIHFVTTSLDTVFGPVKHLMRCFSCISSDFSADFFDDEDKELAVMRPAICTKSKSVVVKFNEHPTDEQRRAAILGASLLFFVVTVYPEFGESLRRSCS